MANTRCNRHDEDVPPYMRLDTLRQMLGESSMRANQAPKPRWNPTKSPAYPPQNDHEPHHFGEDHSDDEDIAGVVNQGTEEKDDQVPDSIPKEDSSLGSAVWSLLHELNERIEALESSKPSQDGWNDGMKLAMDQIYQILDPGEIPETKKTTRTKHPAQ